MPWGNAKPGEPPQPVAQLVTFDFNLGVRQVWPYLAIRFGALHPHGWGPRFLFLQRFLPSASRRFPVANLVTFDFNLGVRQV